MHQKTEAGPTRRPTRRHQEAAAVPHPRSVPVPTEDVAAAVTDDQPFEEGAHDIIDADLRHRMISETAYSLYVQRGYADGFDVEDWLAAEAAVDHLLTGRRGELQGVLDVAGQAGARRA